MAVRGSAAAKDMLTIGEMDAKVIGRFRRVLTGGLTSSSEQPVKRPTLVGANNQEMELPEPIYQLLCDIVPFLKRGDSLFLMPENRALTTQEAAEVLGMSRPYLTKLVDHGEIPSFRVGSHRRIRFKDLVEFNRRREDEQRAAMDEILALSDEMGVYK